MHELDPLWNPRSPPEFYSAANGDDAPELPDILVRLRKSKGRDPPHLAAPVSGPMTLRATLQLNCCVATGGVVAREFQLDVGEAVYRNQDVIVQAFTGSGKYLAMVILLFTYPDKFLIMASPLNNLQESMSESFAKWGLVSYAYNANARTPAMLRELRAKRFDVLETAPENLVEPGALRPLLTDPNWTANCLAIAIDEGHCIIDWGLSGFRPAYARLELLRSFMAHSVPFIVVSATLSPETMSALARILHFRPGFKTINLGNIRPNIFWEVRTVDNGQKTSFHYLRFLLPTVTTSETVSAIPSTIVFVPSRGLTCRAANYLRGLLPEPLRHETVLPLHAKSKPGRISRVLQSFESGRTRILVATTVAGLGRDFRDVRRVIGYMPPENIEAWVQEAGRGARKESARCLALLLVPKSVFTLKKVKAESQSEAPSDEHSAAGATQTEPAAEPSSAEDPDDLVSYQTAMELVETDSYVKKLSAPMRAFIAPRETFKPGDLCRCQILAGYFDNPTTPTDLCDVCRERRMGNTAALSQMPPFIADLTRPSDSSAPANDAAPAQSKPRAPASRVKDRLATAVDKLRTWRMAEWLENWQDTGLTLDDLVPDDTLDVVAKCLKLYALEDLKPLLPSHVFDLFARQLLNVMLDVLEVETQAERELRAQRERQKQEDAQRRADEKERVRIAKEAERERKRVEKEAERARKLAEKEARKAVKWSGSLQPPNRPLKRSRALDEVTNSPPRAGPSRQPARQPAIALPPFNLPSLAGLSARHASLIQPVPFDFSPTIHKPLTVKKEEQ